MVDHARTFTPAEAGVVSGLGRKVIDNAIDKKVVPVRRKSASQKGGRVARRLTETELVWIYVNSHAPGAIPVAERVPLFERFVAKADAKSLRVSDLVTVDLTPARNEIKAGAAALDRAKAKIVSDPAILGGEPVFRGTRVPVYDVAASLEKGISRDRILAAYPSLDEQALEQARLYAEAFPARGRPRGPARTQPALVLASETIVRRKRSE